VFDRAAMAAQARRHEIQGVNGTFFAGAYWGYGFHEDGVQSALEVARAIREER
jgi:predicted NAD/FAD-binding protein